jgi:hypothetical protein
VRLAQSINDGGKELLNYEKDEKIAARLVPFNPQPKNANRKLLQLEYPRGIA